jgi:predicted enzyme related to lactoylglutathione lyase
VEGGSHVVGLRMVCVDATDVAAATSEALALGATLADDVYAAGRWQVLRDPEGNEFCLLPLELS